MSASRHGPARVENIDALERTLNDIFAAREVAEWVGILREAAVPVGPINDVAEAFALAEELGLNPIDHSTRVPIARPAIGTVKLPPPTLDEHGDAIRAWLRER